MIDKANVCVALFSSQVRYDIGEYFTARFWGFPIRADKRRLHSESRLPITSVIYRASSTRYIFLPVAFFFVIPAWLICVLLGTALACAQGLRRTGIYLIAVSTGGTVVSLLLSTAALFIGPRIVLRQFGKWSGIAIVATYVLAILAGGFIGSASGFFLIRKLLPPRKSL